MNQRFLVLLGSIAVAALAALAHEQAAANPGRASTRTILFVDDHDVLYRAGVQRVLQPLRRHSDKALLELTHPWEVGIGFTSVYRDPKTGKYQLWYQAYGGARAGERRLKCVVCYAESADGLQFERPLFDLFPYKGQKSNIVLVANGGYGDRYCCSVLVDPEEKDPARRYKMAYYDWSLVGAREEPGLHVAFSPDGIHWTKHKGPLLPSHYGGRGVQPPFKGETPYKETPVPGKPARKTWSYPLSLSDVIDVFWDPVRRLFVIIGKVWLDGPDGGAAWRNGLVRSESKDFLNWSKPELVLVPDDEDDPEVDFHGAGAFFYQGRYFALNQVLLRKEKLAIDLELMTSRDGITWERPFRKHFFLPRSKPGLFDSRTLLSNSTPVVHGDEIRFYYGAANVAPLQGVKSDPAQRSGVGLASIPLDRFAGLQTLARTARPSGGKPFENIGQVTLKPLDLKQYRQLTLNADASQGSVRVEILDDAGQRLKGWCRDDAIPIQGDSLGHIVAWKEKQLEQLPPGRYLVRLHLENAKLFALTLR